MRQNRGLIIFNSDSYFMTHQMNSNIKVEASSISWTKVQSAGIDAGFGHRNNFFILRIRFIWVVSSCITHFYESYFLIHEWVINESFQPNLSNDTLFQFENFQSSKPVHFFELWNRNSEAINCSVGGDFRSPHWSRACNFIIAR